MNELIDRSPLQELLIKCTIKLLDSSGEFIGTGFFITQEKIATCFHTIFPKGSTPINNFKVEGIDRVLTLDNIQDQNKEFDLLIINLKQKSSQYCVNLSVDLNKSEDSLWGWSFNTKYRDGVGISLKLEDEATHNKIKVFKVQKGSIKLGSSGTPVLNLRTGNLLGVIYWLVDDSALIMPINRFKEVFLEIFEENQQHHSQHTYWMIAKRKSSPSEESRRNQIGELQSVTSQGGLGNYLSAALLFDKVVSIVKKRFPSKNKSTGSSNPKPDDNKPDDGEAKNILDQIFLDEHKIIDEQTVIEHHPIIEANKIPIRDTYKRGDDDGKNTNDDDEDDDDNNITTHIINILE